MHFVSKMNRTRRAPLGMSVDLLESRLFLSTARVAVIGDYGADTDGNAAQELSVANLVKGWDTAAAPLQGVVTLGDNNYDAGEWSTIDPNIGKYYGDYIGNYRGNGAANRFFPCLGNHDWASTVDHDNDGVKGADPYLDYFSLPGNERYYDYQIGPIQFFVVDSDPHEPDGYDSSSTQAQWLQAGLAASTAPWQVVYFHHAAYSSSNSHGSDPDMQWPFASWGADAVFSGHDHEYERLTVDGIPYFVNAAGGRNLHGFIDPPLPQSQVRYNADFGAQLIEADDTTMTIRFYNSGYQRSQTLVDGITLDKNAVPPPPPPSSGSATFRNGVNGYVGTQDTHLRQDAPSSAYGPAARVIVDLDANIAAGNQPVQGLLRFDSLFGPAAGQVPAGAAVTSATLTLYTGTATGDSSATATAFHRMLGAWAESSTWDSLSNGLTADGGEAASTPDGSATPSVLGGAVSIDVTESLRAWAAAPASNFGWALLPAGNDKWQFVSSESADVSKRPSLLVTYDRVTNQPPTVNAGPDLTITLPSSATLDGTVSDDVLPDPPAAVTTAWSQVSGPGTVTFADAAAVDTTATFSAAGTYVLRLTANDGAAATSDDVSVVANAAPSTDPTLETLQTRQLFTGTAQTPQSKLWKYDGTWWAVLPNGTGTWVWRLDGTQWTAVLKLSTSTSVHADALPIGDVTHVLLFRGASSQLASVQYVPGAPGSPGTYQLWSPRTTSAPVSLSGEARTATIAMDSAGRMWLASDGSTTIDARYSDYPYSTWSAPITIASGITADDISSAVAMADGSVGIFWSDQATRRFGFRTHAAGDAAETWSADEVPASQSALNVGLGMANDHMNLHVASDGTMYAAVRTSYNTAGYPLVSLLIRRPTGRWDDLYSVDTLGTRPIGILNEAQGTFTVVYSDEATDDIVYRTTSLSNISFGPKQTLIQGTLNLNNASSTKQAVEDDAVVVAANTSYVMYGVHITWPAPPPAITAASLVESQDGSPSTTGITGQVLFSDTAVP